MRARDLNSVFVNSSGGPLLAVASDRWTGPRSTSSHAHSRGQIFGVRRGVLAVTTSADRWVVPATHAVWVPPHRTHAVEVFGAYEGFSAYVEELAALDLAREAFALRVSPLLRAALDRAAAWSGAKDLSEEERHVALVVLDEIRAGRPEPFGLPFPNDPTARHIAELVLLDLADDRTLTELAKATGTTTRTAARHFVSESGFTFTEWRQRARVLASFERLASGASVLDVALSLGYTSSSAFTTMFRRITGRTPGDVRARGWQTDAETTTDEGSRRRRGQRHDG